MIGARAGGVPDVIDDGRDGLLVPFADVPALAGAIRTLLTDRALAAELGARGRAKVHERYTWDHVTAAFAALYDEVTGAKSDERRATSAGAAAAEERALQPPTASDGARVGARLASDERGA